MTEPTHKKAGFKKVQSATFSIDGFSFTIGKRIFFQCVYMCVLVCACVCQRERNENVSFCGWLEIFVIATSEFKKKHGFQ